MGVALEPSATAAAARPCPALGGIIASSGVGRFFVMTLTFLGGFGMVYGFMSSPDEKFKGTPLVDNIAIPASNILGALVGAAFAKIGLP